MTLRFCNDWEKYASRFSYLWGRDAPGRFSQSSLVTVNYNHNLKTDLIQQTMQDYETSRHILRRARQSPQGIEKEEACWTVLPTCLPQDEKQCGSPRPLRLPNKIIHPFLHPEPKALPTMRNSSVEPTVAIGGREMNFPAALVAARQQGKCGGSNPGRYGFCTSV